MTNNGLVHSIFTLGSLQVLPLNLRQLISYFFALIIYSINLLKTARKTFATGNAIYPLPRTIIHITNDNSIFRKEGICLMLSTFTVLFMLVVVCVWTPVLSFALGPSAQLYPRAYSAVKMVLARN